MNPEKEVTSMLREKRPFALPGVGLLILTVILDIGGITLLIASIATLRPVGIIASVIGLLLLCLFSAGFFFVNPNEGKVLQLFGDYRGTAREAGLTWANPFYKKRGLSMRVRNFETAKLKVNDIRGNPIEIATVVVWQVVDTAEAAFQVDNYENFVHVQSEAALRSLAMGYPYDSHTEGEVSLSGQPGEISERLKGEIQERLTQAGVQVREARISHLAYAAEIASAMLRRQQAAAVVAARQKIVEGAVGMVEHALELLAQKNVLTLDEERKAAMVSNLLVVLCSEHQTQPVVNAGTLYT
jgi:regulator of protease activity HflC (stomatin/prohibitin superfamily)